MSAADLEDSVQIEINKDGNPIVEGEPYVSPDSDRVSTKQEYQVTTLAVKNVTVFVDRAEVNRIVETDEVEAGDVEVVIEKLPVCIDEDSVRVTCFGAATIVEVAYQAKAVTEKIVNNELQKQNETETEKIQKSIKDLTDSRNVLKDKIKVLENERDILESYAKCVSSTKQDKVGEVLEKKSVENMLSFLAIYKDRSEKLVDTLFKSREKVTEITKEIDVMTANLSKLKPAERELVKQERNISILLDASAKGKISLVVSYVVSNASWTPLYDVRAFNKDSTVQILYFATIKQNTGEDWNDAKLSLSTAMPSVGGSPPKLNAQILSYVTPIHHQKRSKSFGFRKRYSREIESNRAQVGSLGSVRGRKAASNRLVLNEYDPTIEDSYMGSQMEYESEPATALTSEGMTSTNFEIARPATIQSDNIGHKVSIAQIDFKPEFEYISTPKLVAHAFLKIKTKNESSYALLAGDANVFLDNNFLTKSFLPAVSPMEDFEISLGADPAVKLDYKPLKKFQQTSGVISKAHVYNFHQVIEIKNTKSEVVKITVTDQCPKSSTEKVKTTLQEPDIKIPKATSSSEPSVVKSGNISLHTSDYAIEWVLEIPPNETKKVNLRYQVEHPIGTSITGL